MEKSGLHFKPGFAITEFYLDQERHNNKHAYQPLQQFCWFRCLGFLRQSGSFIAQYHLGDCF